MHVTDYTRQEMYERKYSEYILRKEISDWLEGAYAPQLATATKALTDWLHTPATYASKQDRLNKVIADLEPRELVLKAACMVSMQDRLTMQQAAAQMITGFPSHWGMPVPDMVRTASEILARIGWEDLYTVEYGGGQEPVLISDMELPAMFAERIQLAGHPLPMLIEPEPLRSNRSTGYINIPGSLILGSRHNHHEGEICRSVLEIQNSVGMKLNLDFLMKVDDIRPTFETQEQEIQWEHLNKDTKLIARDLIKAGNWFWFTYRVDTRGRMYARGYQINPQGNSWRKAMLELHREQHVEIDP